MTEFLARVSARRPWVTIGVWLVVLVVALALIRSLLPSATTTEFRLGSSYESQRASALLEDRLRGPKPLAELVIVQSPTLTVDDPEFRAKVESIHAQITALGPDKVQLGLHYYLTNDPLLVSADRRTTIMSFVLAGDVKEATENVEDVIHVVREADGADDFRVLIGGDASVAFENNELSAEDLEKGERVGIPVALIILLALFGAVVATLLPLGLAIVAIVLALAAVSVIGQAFELIFFVTMMITMIGLAVGIDYSLLIVSRFKEEMGRGLQPKDAVANTGNTAGRTVFFSGATVVLALLGLLIVPVSFYQSLALGAILVVIAALAATLTLLPAVLALLGPRVNLLTIPFLTRFSLKSPEATEQGFWEAITRAVTRLPVVSILVVGVPMVLVTLFYFNIGIFGIQGIKTGLNDVNTFPDAAKTKEAFILLKEEFSVGDVTPAGVLSPAEIVIDGDIDSPQVQEATARLVKSLQEDPAFPLPPSPQVNDAGDLALLTLPFPGEPNSRAATEKMATLREVHVADAFDGVPAEVHVGGVTAEATDFFNIVDVYTPIVFAFVLGLSFIILMLAFRSIVIPIKAIIFHDAEEALKLYDIGLICEPTYQTESVVMAHSLVNSAPLIAGVAEPEARRSLAQYVYRVSRGLIGKETADSLMYPPLSSFGVVTWFKLQQRYNHILGKLFLGRRQDSNFARFTSLLETSLFDEDGIRYTLPDHVYAEESTTW